MVVIKKSVTIHPIVDEVVRNLWAILIQKGYDATYSTTLNMLAIGGCIATALIKEGSKEWQEYFKTINDFLDGRIEMRTVKYSSNITNYEKYITSKVKEIREEKNNEGG